MTPAFLSSGRLLGFGVGVLLLYSSCSWLFLLGVLHFGVCNGDEELPSLLAWFLVDVHSHPLVFAWVVVAARSCWIEA